MHVELFYLWAKYCTSVIWLGILFNATFLNEIKINASPSARYDFWYKGVSSSEIKIELVFVFYWNVSTYFTDFTYFLRIWHMIETHVLNNLFASYYRLQLPVNLLTGNFIK